jgi:hypothetical protein
LDVDEIINVGINFSRWWSWRDVPTWADASGDWPSELGGIFCVGNVLIGLKKEKKRKNVIKLASSARISRFLFGRFPRFKFNWLNRNESSAREPSIIGAENKTNGARNFQIFISKMKKSNGRNEINFDEADDL